MNSLYKIFDRLNLTEENGLYITSKGKWHGMFSNRIERLIKQTIKPDALFSIDNKPFILFFESVEQKKRKLKEIWNFNQSPVVIIVEKDSIEIYNGFNYLSEEKSLQKLGSEEKLDDFNYFKLVSGETWEQYQEYFSYDKRVDYHLLSNINATRERLLSDSIGLSKELANSFIGKAIFVRYLIDRNVRLNFEQKGKSRKWSNKEFCHLLNDRNKTNLFFQYLSKKFNGDLFPIDEEDFDKISDHCFTLLIKLLSGEEITSGQTSLFDLYDFSIIPVEFISNVYEVFIGQDEQEKKGAYYTPLFLVDYIISQTVKKKLQDDSDNYSCKVLDPACGSGIFLVETLRKIIEQYQKANPNYLENISSYKQKLKKLTRENIYGIDKDKSAVNVAIFSIYLTLLDYQEPSDIETFKFPRLLGTNFFPSDFFDVKENFNEHLHNFDFDFILGNPPWKRGRGSETNPLYLQYIEERRSIEPDNDINIEISNKEIAQAFVLRVSDFSSPSTQIALIVTSKILYNLNAIGFRRYWLDQFFINKVFELAPVRKEVFDKSNDPAVGPATIIFYQYANGEDTNSQIVDHIALKPSRFFSLFKVFTLQKNDYKQVEQRQLKKYDYLWKVLVYGSYLDFNLVKRLKECYPSVNTIVSNDEDFIIGQGAMVGGGDNNDASHLSGKPLLDTKKDIDAFWINPDPKNIWNFSTVHRPRNENLYKAPMLLVTKGIDKKFRSVSAICRFDTVFRSSLTAIKSTNNDLSTLQSIEGLLNSSFFSYFCVQAFSSSGIEREQSHDEEKFSIPFVVNESITQVAGELRDLKEKKKSEDFKTDPTIDSQIQQKMEKLDKTVITSFSFSEQEKDLLDYSVNVTIPMLMKHNGYQKLYEPLDFKDKIIEEYLHLFLSNFNEVFRELEQQINVKVKYSKHIIGLFFKLDTLDSDRAPISWEKSEDSEVLQVLSSLGSEKITNQLFIRKDIRGFEEYGFYIVKPNERKLWHKAIGYIDVNDFVDSILTTGKKSVVNV